MYPHDVRDRLRAALDQAPAPTPGPGERLAAVLAPIIDTREHSLVFTVRSSDLSRHAGEISFPGGLQDGTESLLETALRETAEEIGLDGTSVDVLGALSSVPISVSSTLVVPFVGLVTAPPSFTASDEEIADVLTFPVARLAAVEGTAEYERPGGRTWRGWAYELEGHTIWGATGWMLHELLELLRSETLWANP